MTDQGAKLGDFTEQADSYLRSRPGYPDVLTARLISGAGVSAGDPVAEIGAGTGAFTRELANLGFCVDAVEPNQAMRERAPAHLNVVYREGTFEDTGLESSRYPWVVAAQSFHWADRPRAIQEILRILRPKGCFSILWNCREYDRCEILAMTKELIEQHVPDFFPVYRETDWMEVLSSTGAFSSVTFDSCRHRVPMSIHRYLEVWKSHHRLNLIAGKERFSVFIQALSVELDRRSVREVIVPYECRAWTGAVKERS